ncbi:MAG: hypothetical protein HEP71_26125 [Roseivirga sp.]|nr:hypothetical protein [Roseivirga sp.]
MKDAVGIYCKATAPDDSTGTDSGVSSALLARHLLAIAFADSEEQAIGLALSITRSAK